MSRADNRAPNRLLGCLVRVAMTAAVAIVTVMMWMVDRDNAYWILPVVAVAWIVMIGVWVWLAGFFSKSGGEARGFSVMQDQTPRDRPGSE